jgi:TP901 family phage tail tape measure protein
MARSKEGKVIITAEDRTGAALRSFSAGFKKAEKDAQSLASSFAPVSLAATGALAASTKEAYSFSKVMLDVQKNVSGLDGTGLSDFKDELLAIGANSQIGARGVAALASEGGKLGLAKDEALKFAKAAEQMAVAFDFGTSLEAVEEAGGIIGKLRTGFKITTDEVMELADAINVFADTTASNSKNITEILVRQGGTLAATTGLARQEIAALAATMDAAAPSPEIAATGMKNLANALTKGSAATDNQVAQFKKLGFETTELAERMQTDAVGAILDVLGAIKKLPDAQRNASLSKIFGEESKGAIAPLLNNLEELEKNFKKAGESAGFLGSVKKEFDRLNDSDAGKITKSLSSLTVAAIRLGDVILPPLAEIATKVADLAKRFNEAAGDNAGIAKMGVLFLGVAAAAAPVLLVAGQMIGAVASMASAFAASGAVAATFGGIIAALTSPVTIIVAAIVGAIVLLVKNWDTIKPAIMATIDYIVGAFKAWREHNAETINGINQSFQSIAESVGTIVTSMIEWLDQLLEPIGGVSGAFEIMAGMIGNIFDAVGNVIQEFISIVASYFKIVADIITGQTTIWEGLKSMVESMITAIVNLVKDLKDQIETSLNIDLAQMGKDMMQGLLNGISAGVKIVVDKVKGIGESIKSTFADTLEIKSPSRVFKAFGANIVAGLALGMAPAQAEASAEALAVKTIQAFEAKMQEAQGGGQSMQGLGTSPQSLGFGGGGFGGGGFGGGGFGGGGFGGGGFGGGDESQALASEQEELQRFRDFNAQKLLILKESGLAQTEVARRLEDERRAITTASLQNQLASYSTGFGGILDLTAAFASEQSGLYKGLFAASKAFAIAESIIKIQQGIANAMSLPFPANLAAAGVVAAQSAKIVSTIKGQSMPSFEGGGETRSGARVGGLDGKGGYTAMIHPQETIIDRTRANSAGAMGGITVNLSISGDPNPSVVEKIKGEAISMTLRILEERNRR